MSAAWLAREYKIFGIWWGRKSLGDDDEEDNNRLEYFIVHVHGLEGVVAAAAAAAAYDLRSDLFVFSKRSSPRGNMLML